MCHCMYWSVRIDCIQSNRNRSNARVPPYRWMATNGRTAATTTRSRRHQQQISIHYTRKMKRGKPTRQKHGDVDRIAEAKTGHGPRRTFKRLDCRDCDCAMTTSHAIRYRPKANALHNDAL
mmetsp:Transcript_18822/g.52317  ORF Transcript_18822/g.52317 Transcript_18822/m.52317 type:complete len:121 (+) Transcript_18822:402-764(+)